MPPKGDLWKYFEKSKDKGVAVCRFCGKQIKTSGNTSNLRCHLNSMHKEVLQKSSLETSRVTADIDDKQNDGESDADTISIIEDESIGETNESESTHSSNLPVPFKRQKTINESFSFLKSHSIGGRRYNKITNTILFMICRDYQPLSIVENEGFIELMHTVCPQYKIPSRKTITSLIDKKYESTSNLIRDKIKNADTVTLTCDIWTETMHSKSFLGVTIHFLDGSEILDGNLGIFELRERHTGDYIADYLKNLCQEWTIPDDKLICIVTDGAANMVKAIDVEFGKQKHIICFAHLLNLTVTHALEQVAELSEIIKKVKIIVRWFKLSVGASDLLRKAQQDQNEEPQLTLKQDVPTRWNSTYYMVERFLKLRPHVNTIISTEISAPAMLSAREIRELQVIVDLLQPFEHATREISGSKYTTGSIIMPLVRNLTLCIEKAEAGHFEVSKSLKANLIKELDKRMGSIEQITMLAAATVIDPRFKKMYFKNPIYCARAIELIHDMVKKKHNQHPSQSEIDQNKMVSESEGNNVTNKFSLWGEHKRIVAEKSMQADIVGASTEVENSQAEMIHYLKQPPEQLECNPIEWWQRHTLVYPNLAPNALKLLSVIATTSVPSERLFSKAGETMAQKRNSLQGNRLSKLLFLQSINKKFWDLN